MSRRAAAMSILTEIDAADGKVDGRLQAIDEDIAPVDLQRLDYEISVVAPAVVDAIQREIWLYPMTYKKTIMENLEDAISVMAYAIRDTDDPGMLAFLDNRDMLAAYVSALVENAQTSDVRVFAVSMAKAMGKMGGEGEDEDYERFLAYAGAEAVFKFAEADGDGRPRRLSMDGGFTFLWFILACLAIFASYTAHREVKVEQKIMEMAQRPPPEPGIAAAVGEVASEYTTWGITKATSAASDAWAAASEWAWPPSEREQAEQQMKAEADLDRQRAAGVSDLDAVAVAVERMPAATFENAILQMDIFAGAWTVVSLMMPVLIIGLYADQLTGEIIGLRVRGKTRQVLYGIALGGTLMGAVGAMYYRYNLGRFILDEISAGQDFGTRLSGWWYNTHPVVAQLAALFSSGGLGAVAFKRIMAEQLRSHGKKRAPGETTEAERKAKRVSDTANRLKIAGGNFLIRFVVTQPAIEDAVFDHNAAYAKWKILKKRLPRTTLSEADNERYRSISEEMEPLLAKMIKIRQRYNKETEALRLQAAAIDSAISENADEIAEAVTMLGRAMTYGPQGTARVTGSQFLNTIRNYQGLAVLANDATFAAVFGGQGAVAKTVLTNVLSRIKEAQGRSTTPLSALDMSRVIIYDGDVQKLSESMLDRLLAKVDVEISTGSTFEDFLITNGKSYANIGTKAELAAYRRAYIARAGGEDALSKKQKASISALAIKWRDAQRRENAMNSVDLVNFAAVGGLHGERLDPGVRALEREFEQMLEGRDIAPVAGAGRSSISSSYGRPGARPSPFGAGAGAPPFGAGVGGAGAGAGSAGAGAGQPPPLPSYPAPEGYTYQLTGSNIWRVARIKRPA